MSILVVYSFLFQSIKYTTIGSVDRHSGCFQLRDIIKKEAMSICVQVFVTTGFHFGEINTEEWNGLIKGF